MQWVHAPCAVIGKVDVALPWVVAVVACLHIRCAQRCGEGNFIIQAGHRRFCGIEPRTLCHLLPCGIPLPLPPPLGRGRHHFLQLLLLVSTEP